MSTPNSTSLARQISQVIYPYLEPLLRGDDLPSFLPGTKLAQDIWAYLAAPIRADWSLTTRLEQLSFRSDPEEARTILSWELEHLLTALTSEDLQAISTLVSGSESDALPSQPDLPEMVAPISPGGEPEDVYRSWEPELASMPETAGEVYRSWDLGEAMTGAEPPGQSAEPPGEEAGAAPEGFAEATSTPRYLRAEITEGDHSQPLAPNQEFTLAFFVALEAGGAHDAAARFEEEGVFSEGEQVARLQVMLSSRDFIVHTRTPQELRIPRRGPSRNKARFDLEPRPDWTGTGEVTALFYKENNFVQGMTLQLNVGSGEGVFHAAPERLGRPLERIKALQPRDLLLFIKKATDGFELTMVGAVASQAFLRMSTQALNEKIMEARKALLDVVYLAKGPGGIFVQPMNKSIPSGTTLPYQLGLDIPPDIAQVGLQKLAEAGWLLFDSLFYGDGMGADANALGDHLRTLSSEGTLKLQIVSQEFFLPWGLLYLADYVDPDHIDPEKFLGMNHIIEHIPLQNDMQVHDERIPGQGLAISLNLDNRIDATLKIHAIADQRTFWDQVASAHPVSIQLRENSVEFLEAMKTAPEQILYFYGHAESKDLGEDGGSGSSSLSFSDQKTVTLRDLKLRAPARMPLSGTPLVFINACESAELSPLFYGGFMPYFLSKGARGMVGTECQVPAIFAAEWAKQFFQKFLFDEQPIGELFLELRREFYKNHSNPLGLLYALYCDGDTRIAPRL